MVQQTIADKIAEAGRDGIARVSVDGTTVEAMTVDDLIKAEQHGEKRTAAAKNHLGLTFRTLTPGGTG